MANTIFVDIVADSTGLVNGINKANAQLNGLGATVGSLKTPFLAFGKLLGGLFAVRGGFNLVKDVEQERKDLAALRRRFGSDATALERDIKSLSQKFFIDDGIILSNAVELGANLNDTYKGLTDEVLGLVLQVNNVTGKPIEAVTKTFINAINAGKKFSGDEMFKLLDLGAVIGDDPGNKIANRIKGLGTINEQVQALAQINKNITPNISPIDKLGFSLNQLKEAVAAPLADAIAYVTPYIEKLVAALLTKDGDLNALGLALAALLVTLGTWKVAIKTGLAGIITFLLRLAAGVLGVSIAVKAARGDWDDMKVFFKEAIDDGALTKWKAFTLQIGTYFPRAVGLFITSIATLKNLKLGGILTGLLVLSDEDNRRVLASWADLGKRVLILLFELLILAPLKYLFSLLPDSIQEGIKNMAASVIPKLKEFGKQAMQGIIAGLTIDLVYFDNFFRNFFKNLWDGIVRWAQSFFQIGSPSRKMMELAQHILQGFINGFLSFGAIWNMIDHIFNNFKNSVINWLNGTSFVTFGREIISGLVRGMQDLASQPLTFISNLAQNMKNRFKSLFNISSPSKIFVGYGENMMQGLAMGIAGNTSLPVNSLRNVSGALAFRGGGSRGGSTVININAGLGTDSYELGRVVSAALKKYSGVSGG